MNETAAPLPGGGTLEYAAIIDRPCDLLRADQAAALGWMWPGREESSEIGKSCVWSAVTSGTHARATAIGFDGPRLRSVFAASDTTISGWPALQANLIIANLFVDLGGQRGLWVDVPASDGGTASAERAAEALAAALLENVRP